MDSLQLVAAATLGLILAVAPIILLVRILIVLCEIRDRIGYRQPGQEILSQYPKNRSEGG